MIDSLEISLKELHSLSSLEHIKINADTEHN